ncbi:MucBP domain-containing protein, partial [Streptococcus sp. S784/96/1]|uniref:MucBP domain-containing protein n=1 Tax=Streptococcus sp. S784/96/1 TaxID=2653499 RepID=UPI001386A887
MKHTRKDRRYPEKCQRFSIRKFNAGVASVAIAAFWMLGATAVSASEVSEVTTEESIVAVESSDDTKASPDSSQMESKAMEETEITPQILNQDEGATSTENEVQENVELDRSELDNILLQIRSLDREQLTDLDVKQIDYYLSLSNAVSNQEEIDELSLMISSYISRLGTAVSSDDNIMLRSVRSVRSVADKTKGTFFVPADDVTITEVDGVETNSIPTDDFTTTKPSVYNMQTGQPNTNDSTPKTVYHDPSRYTFAVIYTAHHGDFYNSNVGYETSGKIWFGNEGTNYAGEYYTGAWRNQYTRVDQIAFSTDEDGSGRVYVTYYSGDGKVIKEDVFEEGHNREIKYSYRGSSPYIFRYTMTTALTDKPNPTIAVDGPYPEGWFNELYTNYTRHNGWLTKNRYISYGYDVPVLVDRPTEYRDAETGQLLGTVIQTELSGYSFETSAPQTLKTSDGKTYTLVEERSENTSGKVTSLVNIHDGLNVPRDAGYIVRHELIDEDGTIAWYILDEHGNRTYNLETGEVATGNLALGEQITVKVHVPRQGDTTFWINNPASSVGKTTYYYRAVAKTGSVNVRYITEDGQELEATSPVKTDVPVGTDYTTEQKSFEGYEFVKVDETGATPTGKVEEGTKLVTYVYKPVAKTGSVNVRYITEDGQELEATSPVKTDVPVGTDYTTEQKS